MFGKNRSYLMGIVGGYLIYIAYQLYNSMGDPDAGMSPPVRIIFIVFFTLAGIVMLLIPVWLKTYEPIVSTVSGIVTLTMVESS